MKNFVSGLKVLMYNVLQGVMGDIASKNLYEVFGPKDINTPDGQFLRLMDDSLSDFCDYLNETISIKFEYDSNAYTRIKMSALNCSSNEELLKAILKEMLGDESYNLLNWQDIEKWLYIVDYKLPQDEYQVLNRYILNHSNSKTQLDTESVLKIVQALNTIRSEETIEDVLCNWFSEQCSVFSDSISKDVLEIGYILADYLEKRRNYGESVKIANQLLVIYKKDKYADMFDKEYIRKIIGCAYSLVIADVHPEEKKWKLLDNAQEFFAEAQKMCQDYENEKSNQYEDIEFLWGLYYSDYAAMLLNKGHFYKSKGELSKADEFYKKAKSTHKLSLKRRKNLRKSLEDSKLYDKIEVDNMIARTKSNLGGAYFWLRQYKISLKWQNEALTTFIKQGDRIREYRTKELIVGNYLSLWKNNPKLKTQSDVDMCMGYMESAKFYYEITNNKSVIGVLEKIEKIKDI